MRSTGSARCAATLTRVLPHVVCGTVGPDARSRAQFLDICEARDLFHILFYDDLGAERFAQAMVDVRVFLDHKGELNLDAVVDALVFVTSKYGLGVPESKVPKQLETAASFDSDAKARPYVGISRKRVSPGPQQGGSA